MTYDEDMALRLQVFEAIRDAWGETPHALAMREQISRWFKRTWEPHPAKGGAVCALCEWQGPSFSIGSSGVRRSRDRAAGQRTPVCDECVNAAQRLLDDPNYPHRDMVRSDAVRALRAAGAEQAAEAIERLASEYPDLRLDRAACSGCGGHPRAVARGVAAAICRECVATALVLER